MCLDFIFITRVIDAIENWNVAIIDLPGAFLHADFECDDQVLIIMEVRVAENNRTKNILEVCCKIQQWEEGVVCEISKLLYFTQRY